MTYFPIIGAVVFVIILVAALVIYKSSERYTPDVHTSDTQFNPNIHCGGFIKSRVYDGDVLDNAKTADYITNTYIPDIQNKINTNKDVQKNSFYLRNIQNASKCINYFNTNPVIRKQHSAPINYTMD